MSMPRVKDGLLSEASFIKLTYLSGGPDGVAIRYLEGSDALAVSAPRHHVADALLLEEAARNGVYLLFGSQRDEMGRLPAYIGEGGIVARRLGTHLTSPDKGFFTQAALLTTLADRITPDMASHVERRLCDLLEGTGLVRLTNKRRCLPRPLRRDQRELAERFLRDGLLLLSCAHPSIAEASLMASDLVNRGAGLDPETATEQAWSDQLESHRDKPGPPLFEMRRGAFHALARTTATRGLKVLAGSRVATATQPSTPRPTLLERERLQLAGKIRRTRDPRTSLLTVDVDFPSFTAASSFVAGAVISGPRTWRAVGSDAVVATRAGFVARKRGGGPRGRPKPAEAPARP